MRGPSVGHTLPSIPPTMNSMAATAPGLPLSPARLSALPELRGRREPLLVVLGHGRHSLKACRIRSSQGQGPPTQSGRAPGR